jgi:hypothetical protein
LLRAIAAAGFDSASAFARSLGMQPTRISEYVNLRRAPISGAAFRDDVLSIAAALGKNPAELFPVAFLDRCLPTNVVEREIFEVDLTSFLERPKGALAGLIADEAAIQIEALLRRLNNARQEEVIRRRYGLGREQQTLQEIADYLNVTPERVRQIEQKTLRRLRHPMWRERVPSLEDLTA